MTKTIDIPVAEERRVREPPESYFVPATDIYETADELLLVADLPGIKPDGLDVTVEDNVLVIHGAPPGEPGEPAKAGPAGRDGPNEEAKEPGTSLLQEFAAGEFYRAFQLPADFDTARIQATLKQGVLKVRLPKSERMKPRRIEVKAE